MFAIIDYHTILCLIGIGLSAYGYYVKKKKTQDSNYRAMCDISEHMQCSKVLTSKWSKGFGLLPADHFLNISNALIGLTFYAGQIIARSLLGCKAYPILFFANLISSIGSIYLAYILAFKLKDVCLVCIPTYFINFSLLYISYNGWMAN